MSGLCIIGLQWGDEAKGKLVDLLTAKQEVGVRYQGGANAGHTVVVGDQTYKLHHIPSGILNAEVLNVITGGVVLNPPTMLDEIQSLTDRDIQVKRNLKISDRAHVVMPWHLAEDRALDQATQGDNNIGTTLRGIGPCYRDKVADLMPSVWATSTVRNSRSVFEKSSRSSRGFWLASAMSQR